MPRLAVAERLACQRLLQRCFTSVACTRLPTAWPPAELASRVRSLRRAARRRSADWAHDALRTGGTSEGGFSDDGSLTGAGGGGGAAAAWAALASRSSLSLDALLRSMPSAVMDTVGHMISSPRATMRRAGSVLFRDDFGGWPRRGARGRGGGLGWGEGCVWVRVTVLVGRGMCRACRALRVGSQAD